MINILFVTEAILLFSAFKFWANLNNLFRLCCFLDFFPLLLIFRFFRDGDVEGVEIFSIFGTLVASWRRFTEVVLERGGKRGEGSVFWKSG